MDRPVTQCLAFLEKLDQMPRNSLAFTIRVSREIECICVFQRFDDCPNMLFISLNDLILHCETLLRVYGAVFWHKVPNMAIRGQNMKIFAEIVANGRGFSR